MKYKNNKIIYEPGDWITRIGGGWPNHPRVHQLVECKQDGTYLKWTRPGEAPFLNNWELNDIRLATQEEIDEAIENEPIMIGKYEVNIVFNSDHRDAAHIKVGCQTVLKEQFLTIGKKAGWV